MPIIKDLSAILKLVILTGANLVSIARAQGKFGLSAGATASYFSYQQTALQSDNGSAVRPGFNGGIKLDIPLSKHPKDFSFSLTPELFLIQNGANNQYYTAATITSDSLTKISLNYMGLYLPVKYKFQQGPGAFGFYVLAAVYFDYTISSSAANSADQQSVSFNSSSDKTDFGFRGGLGFLFPPNDNKAAFALEIGYNKGLNNIQFYNPYSAQSPTAVSNNGLTIAVSAFF